MNHLLLTLHDRSVEIRCPPAVAGMVAGLFEGSGDARGGSTNRLLISEDGPRRYLVESRFSEPIGDIPEDELPGIVLEEAVRSLIFDLDSAVALHGGAVEWRGAPIIVAGPSATGKTSLVAWFIDNGFGYLSDELVLLTGAGGITPFRRPLLLKPGARERVEGLSFARDARSIASGANRVLLPARRRGEPPASVACGLIIFVRFEAGVPLRIEPMTPARAAFRLMECNLNARNLPDHGMAAIKEFALGTPAVSLAYGDFDQLAGAADTLARWTVESRPTPAAFNRYLSAFRIAEAPPAAPPQATVAPRPIAAATVARYPRRLTIGMATYDDFDGSYFTIQALRMFHPEIVDDTEFLVIDNHPDGPCGAALKALEGWIPAYRYVPRNERSGTAIRDAVFEEASGELVLCLDSHVFVVPGGVARLLAYDRRRDTRDLLQGPLLYDDLKTISTHFEPKWREGMYGTWATDPAGTDPEGKAFEIPMQGLGLFACRRAAWPGFNPAFRGFGGEEGYIHEKVRRRGGRALCLPFLRWMHRFERPLGIPYPNYWEERIRNYLIGRIELGLPTADVEAHFTEFFGEEKARPMLAGVWKEIAAEGLGGTAVSPAVSR